VKDATVGNAGEPPAKRPRWYPQGVPGDLVPQGAKKPEPKPYPEPEPELTAEPEPEPEPEAELTAEEPAERSEKQKEIFARMRAAGAEKRRLKEETRLNRIANLERIRAAKRAAKEEEQAAAPMDAAEPEV
jgi:colicin import membrane protein